MVAAGQGRPGATEGDGTPACFRQIDPSEAIALLPTEPPSRAADSIHLCHEARRALAKNGGENGQKTTTRTAFTVDALGRLRHWAKLRHIYFSHVRYFSKKV